MTSSKELDVLPYRARRELPRPDLSAREALPILDELARTIDVDDFTLFKIASEGSADSTGRISKRTGAWGAWYCSISRRVVVRAYVFFNGNCGVEYEPWPSYVAQPTSIVGEWIDSTIAASAVVQVPVCNDYTSNAVHFTLMTLDLPRLAIWELCRHGYEPETLKTSTQTFAVDAIHGGILLDTYEVRQHKGDAIGERIEYRKNVRGLGGVDNQ